MVCVILIAEDEVMVRNLVRHILEAEGHEVLAAADGAEALVLARRYQGTIDLLITDVRMPRMDGISLIQELLKERPNLRVLVMSGKTSGELHALPRTLPFLRKPFAASVFREKVRQLPKGPPAPIHRLR